MSTDIAEPKRKLTIRDRLRDPAMIAEIGKAMPNHCKPERMARVAMTALTRTPKLADCTQESFFKCLLDLSALGLEPDGRRAYLIPYGTECTLVVGYQGLAELIHRAGYVSNIHADIVCDNDEFDYDTGEVTKHKIDLRKPRGAMYAAYCIITYRDGSRKCEVMGMDDILSIRERSQGYQAFKRGKTKSHPWETDFNEMAKKTVFRRASKWVPMSSEIREASERDDDTIDAVSVSQSPPASIDDITALLAAPTEGREPGEE